jgi:hypothetical protein
MSLRHRINDDRTNRADRVTPAEKIDNQAVATSATIPTTEGVEYNRSPRL